MASSTSGVGDASITGQSLYSEYARAFRRALLSRDECSNSHDNAKKYLRSVFKEIDKDGDGDVTDAELRDFVKTIDITDDMFDEDLSSKCDKDAFVDILVQQIDINRDGTISYDEMSEFLWPSVESQREIGIVIEIVRQAIKDFLGNALIQKVIKWGTIAEENTLITEYARKTGVKLVRGNLLEIRQLRKSLLKINSAELVSLSDYELTMIIQCIDSNNDRVMSPKEFKSWLLNSSQTYTLTDLTVTPEASPDPPRPRSASGSTAPSIEYCPNTGRRMSLTPVTVPENEVMNILPTQDTDPSTSPPSTSATSPGGSAGVPGTIPGPPSSSSSSSMTPQSMSPRAPARSGSGSGSGSSGKRKLSRASSGSSVKYDPATGRRISVTERNSTKDNITSSDSKNSPTTTVTVDKDSEGGNGSSQTEKEDSKGDEINRINLEEDLSTECTALTWDNAGSNLSGEGNSETEKDGSNSRSTGSDGNEDVGAGNSDDRAVVVAGGNTASKGDGDSDTEDDDIALLATSEGQTNASCCCECCKCCSTCVIM